MRPDIEVIDLRTTTRTMGEVVDRATELKARYPGFEILMDGDSYAIVMRPREAVTYLCYRSAVYRTMLDRFREASRPARIKGAVA